MANPFLPLWEYIPDGEPRVFGDRVYIYGSHDRYNSDSFCDYKLKVWSAPISNLNKWECHGDSFHTADDRDHQSDTDWTHKELYAPDVVEKDAGDDGIYNDAGVLVDDDGRVYIYYGFEHSWMNEINPDNMYEIISGSLIENAIPQDEPYRFFEASSPRKIGDTYYLIFSPKPPCGQRLAYATSDSPTGPFTYRGYIVDNGDQYPAGNNHGSICCINGQWYIFYHRMTNNTIMSRRACVEKIEILPDGSIPTVEMTSLGFEEYLSPYKATPAEIACVLMGGCYVTETDFFTRPITNIKNGAIIGYKYFEFGEDYSSKTMKFFAKVVGMGCKARIRILLDSFEDGAEIGVCDIESHDGVYSATVKSVTGRHALYFVVERRYEGWFVSAFEDKVLFDLVEFSFAR